ncbi:transient-receptor-potential-like protein [Orussus abietinus]|uniref:transient-receptor-potential-like protein n=1 Tax=Orussus abietinus TaxID=222816 RepID=UPI0006255F36|nr:transient-receptor-potential-like protein [Orussus abietinus]
MRLSIVIASPIDVGEKLFFAIFGQKDTDDFTVSLRRNKQPLWTVYLFKVSFSLYMLVSVIVLINLLIAMMTDTYQSIQSQSDIEWKFGLSRLIRKMQKTRTAPSPFNLVTTWISFLFKICRRRSGKKKYSVVDGLEVQHYPVKGTVARSNKVFPTRRKTSMATSLLRKTSPVGSQRSIAAIPRIETVVDWEIVRKKYRMRFGDEVEKPAADETNGTV